MTPCETGTIVYQHKADNQGQTRGLSPFKNFHAVLLFQLSYMTLPYAILKSVFSFQAKHWLIDRAAGTLWVL